MKNWYLTMAIIDLGLALIPPYGPITAVLLIFSGLLFSIYFDKIGV